MKVDIRIEDGAVQAELRRLRARGGDMTPAMRAIAGTLAEVTEEAFKRESGPNDRPWVALKPSTLRRRRGSPNAAKILQDTGQLAGSIQSDYGRDFALVGTHKIYAATHQFGDERRGIPARPFLGLSSEGREEVLGILRRHLRGRGSG